MLHFSFQKNERITRETRERTRKKTKNFHH